MKKTKTKGLLCPSLFKISLKMKLMTLLLMISLLEMHASSYSQNTKVSLNLKNATVEQVFQEIESKTEFKFLYKNKDIELNRKVSITVTKKNINKILIQLFKGTNIEFTVYENRQIILSLQEEPKQLIQKNMDKEVTIKEKQISGQVTDKGGMPIAGANVKVLGTRKNVNTDFAGNFTLMAEKGDVLEFSFVGMKTKRITIGDQSQIKIVMEEEASNLSDVVIVGFAAQKKGSVSAAVATKKMDDILGERPIVNTAAALQGAFGGVLVTSGTGRPGTTAAIQIRGFGSITSPNGGEPLYVVNNVPIASVDDINPNDIETVSILKDAAASSIYGARAAFGVILITTKSGKRNQVTKVDYTTSTSLDFPTELPKKANIYDFVTALNDMQWPSYWTGQNVATWKGFVDDYKVNPAKYPTGYGFASGVKYPLAQSRDLAGEDFYGGFASTRIHNLSVTGGGDKSAFRISGSFSKQDGIIVTDNDSFRKAVLNTDYKCYISDKLTLDVNMNYLSSLTKEPRGSYYNYVTFPTYALTGTQTQALDGSEIPYNTPGNVERYMAAPRIQRDNLRLFSKLEYKPIKSLSIVAEYTYGYSTSNRDDLENTPIFANSVLDGASPALLDGTAKFSSLNTNFGLGRTNATNLYAKYKKNVSDHNFELMVGYNMESLSGRSLTGRSNNLIDPSVPTLNLYTGTQAASDSRYTANTQGYFARLNYNFKERYFLEFNVRRDGSSRFPSTQHWGVFPSGSAAWNVTNESFMKDIAIVSLLKLRGSYGEVGNQNIFKDDKVSADYYGFFGGLSGVKSSWVDPGTNLYLTTLSTPPLVRQDYTWERVRTTNFGIDLGLLHNRLMTSFDLFKRETLDMLAPSTPLPAVLGTGAPKQNAADLEVKGWELEMSWRDKINNFSYYIGLNLSDSQGKITKYLNPSGLISDYYIGQKIGDIYGYVSDGYYTMNDFVAGSVNTTTYLGGTLNPGVVKINGYASLNPGDAKFKDLNGDGIINSGNGTLYTTIDPVTGAVIPNTGLGDQKVIGNSTNRYQYGVTLGGGYKGWDFSIFVQGVGKRDLWVGNEIFFPLVQEFGILYDNQKDYWTPENTNAYYARNYYKGGVNGASNRRIQTKYLANGAYVRLKNITIGYTLPKDIFRNSMIQSVKLFFSGENLLNFDHLPDGLNTTFDNLGNGGTYPSLKQYSFGVNISL